MHSKASEAVRTHQSGELLTLLKTALFSCARVGSASE